MQIDPTSPEHKYVQLQGMLQQYLRDADFEADQKLPTEDELIKRFQVSRVTVRKALQALAEAGVIYKIQGSGTFFSGKMPVNREASYLIGVITPLEFTYIYPQIIQGIGAVAQDKHYNLVLGGSKANPDRELTCLRQLSNKNIDGLIFEPSSGFRYEPDAEIVKMLDALTIPVVFMNWAIDDPQRSYVALDDLEGGALATKYLITAGHRRIACIQPSNHLCGIHRLRGYRQALEDSLIPYDERLVKCSDALLRSTAAETERMLGELLALGAERPTAIVYFNDEFAVFGDRYLRQAGLRIPEDISMIGYDDSDLALQTSVPLTSVIHPKYHIGKWAAEILLEHIETPERRFPRHLLVTPRLAERSSVRRL